ncbi:3-hydroxyacyl-CoA dehydrogenase NAD-binding domain-containing protein [Polynucleobacter sinensis]|uniref:3-hydroxyacyl-CoA dehydrogenase NAD-binding domain-containing protein n=1 Tax=Polynucleobacter sinensis TaxID=1743157 RepID=UPI000782A292|nr:3-hydroxyacyl-CoA dehydrogenase NAD-binding domain-containing protein [Polynucleobacter sinensis]
MSKIKIHSDSNVMVVTVDNPPINAGSAEVRSGLLEAIRELESDGKLEAAVIIGGGTTFIAGSDIKEFSLPLAEPQLPTVIAAIENCSKPVVCALHGAALGGGFELALGCDARIALVGTLLGLPEVTLGIIPGAGGTQRLPRLVGVEKSIELICSGARIQADEALKLGIVNEVVQENLLAHALILARSMIGQKNRIRDISMPTGDADAILAASQKALKAGKNRPQVKEAIAMICNAQALPIDQALAVERESFQTLRVSIEAKALRHQFFAERKLFKALSSNDAQAQALEQIAVIGAGTMGSGIAMACLSAGYAVILLDQDELALHNGVKRVEQFYQSRLQSGRMSQGRVSELLQRFSFGSDWNVISAADLIIEAVFEDIDVKHEVFAKMDTHAKSSALLASNTSYLDIDAIAAKTSNPSRVLGLHFFSPAQVMKLIEIIRCKKTSPVALATGLSFAKRLGKLPIISANSFGFIGNRIYSAYRRQCEFMLEEGAYPEQIDAALEAYGFAMGPFAVADLSGLDIAWRMRKSQAASRDPGHRYVSIPDTLCLAGRLGRKVGAGYYRYPEDSKEKVLDPVVSEIIEAASKEKGIIRRPFNADEIVNRVLLTMINEVAHLLSEGVTTVADDCDIALVNGYGFPRWQGGPVFIARAKGQKLLDQELKQLAKVSGPGFLLANTDVLFI